MKNTLPDDLLARYLASTATREEIERVQTWLDASPENLTELKRYRKLWERSRMIGSQQAPIDTDAAWKKTRARMYENDRPDVSEQAVRPLPVHRRFPLLSRAAAAVALLAVALGWFYFHKMQRPPTVAIETQENTLEATLPDGTKVFLNYNSTLTFPKGLAENTRTVELEGEGFFEVAPDAAHPFVIGVNGTEIRVVGTSFNVKAYDQAVRVEVKSGKVEVRKASKVMELLPGEGVAVESDTVFRTLSANPNMAAYGTQIFDFNGTPLAEVAESLSQGFHAEIRLSDDHLADLRLTARYERISLDATLALVAATMNLRVRKQGDGAYLLEAAAAQ